jgi:hypothetical protein
VETFFAEHEAWIRLGSFIGIFAIMAVWEVAAPCRRLSLTRVRRWSAHLGVVVLNSVVLRLALFLVLATGTILGLVYRDHFNAAVLRTLP